MSGASRTALFMSLPNFDRRYQVHKEMGSGIGFKSLRPRREGAGERRVYPIAEIHYAAAIVREAGHKPIIEDDQYRDSVSRTEYKSELKAKNFLPDVIFLRTSLPTLLDDLAHVPIVREVYPGVPLHVFGPLFAASELVDFVAARRIYDGIISSEIESVVNLILEDVDPILVPGFHVLEKEKYLCAKPTRALADVQNLPLPAYDLVDSSRIDRFIVHTSRGCPIGCNYCPYYLAQGPKFRAKTPERMVEEFQYLSETFHARRITIHDPIFTLDNKRVRRFCELLIEAELGVEWECESHMNHLDTELIRLMHKSGLRLLSFGVESSSGEVLKAAGRRFKDWDKIIENIECARALGVETRAYFILALAQDTVTSAYATIRLAKRLNADKSKFNLPNPYPGTGAYEVALSEGWLDRDLYDNDREAFYRGRGLHNRGEPSMTRHISDRQARFLKRIAGHSLARSSDPRARLIGAAKIVAYKGVVHGLGALRRRSA